MCESWRVERKEYGGGSALDVGWSRVLRISPRPAASMTKRLPRVVSGSTREGLNAQGRAARSSTNEATSTTATQLKLGEELLRSRTVCATALRERRGEEAAVGRGGGALAGVGGGGGRAATGSSALYATAALGIASGGGVGST